MKAWKLYDFNDMRLEGLPEPALREGWEPGPGGGLGRGTGRDPRHLIEL